MERIMFEHLPTSTRILLVSGAGIALAAALATSQPFFDKADVASSGAAPAESAPTEPAGVAGTQDVAKVAEQVKPAVVAVISHVVENAVVAPPLPDQDIQKHPHRFDISQGSGFFITADGYAVTNNHVNGVSGPRSGSTTARPTRQGSWLPIRPAISPSSRSMGVMIFRT
jgi:S1-C subfamily serine protease